MAKRVRVSADDVTYYTLPGNTGELNTEAGQLTDTIFGQDFESSQTGMIGMTINANGIFKGFAGYQATIMKAGTSTLMTAEAMSLVSGKTYEVTAATKRSFDRANTITVLDNAVAVAAANIESIDHLYGRVTFVSGYTPTGPVTVTANYFPLTVLGCANSYTLTQTVNAVDNTCMDTAQGNEGHRTFEYGLKTVSLELEGIYKAANGFKALLEARDEVLIEISPDGTGKNRARGFFKPISTGQSGDVGDLEAETISFNLSVPDDESVLYPFHWVIASDSTLNQAIEICLEAWENSDLVYVQYLSDGTNGWGGQAVITDLTLSGGLEDMNAFTMNFQISGNTSAVP